jgi:hypothetical protein
MATTDVSSTLDAGSEIIYLVVAPHGFRWETMPTHRGHPGDSAGGFFIRDNRRLELHFRWSLGLVIYRLGELALSHDAYMRNTGHKADAHYPGFSSDPLDAFRHLAYDLAHFCSDFLSGSGSAFRTACDLEKSSRPVTGFGALP